MYEADTIAAIATPPGAGGIGVIRVSGPLAATIAERMFRRHRPGSWKTHQLCRGLAVRPDGVAIDDCLAVLMRSPASFTGEDVFEIHCHGSPATLRLVLATVLQHGARSARAGEFTRRAFLNGKLDLTQAEAILELVHAKTSDGALQATNQLLGGLGRHLGDLRRRLIHAKAHLEVQIDFSDEDLTLDAATSDLQAARDEVGRLLESYKQGQLVREGLRLAIIGRPNAGKSSLLNALLGEERAIVTSIPGTTRDVIEETADFAGVPVVLSDTAGLRESPDEIEKIGVELARATARRADLSLLVVDGSLPPEQPAVPIEDIAMVALNKLDLRCAWSPEALRSAFSEVPVVRVSAIKRLGLEELRQAVLTRVGKLPQDGLPIPSSERQRESLVKAHEALSAAVESEAQGMPPEVIAVDVQAALDHIGAVTGAVTSEEVLDAIFAEFCIGK